MKYLALEVPGYGRIEAPDNVPQGLNLGAILTVFLGLFMVVGVVLSISFLSYGGILWITSGGDKQKLEKSRKTIIFSIIGLILMALSLLIVTVVGKLLGVDVIIGT